MSEFRLHIKTRSRGTFITAELPDGRVTHAWGPFDRSTAVRLADQLDADLSAVDAGASEGSEQLASELDSLVLERLTDDEIRTCLAEE